MKKFPYTGYQLTALILLALLFNLSCRSEQSSNSTKENTVDNERLKADNDYLKKAGAEWDKLFNAGDTTNLAALYTEDAVSMPYNYQNVLGRKAIQGELEKFLAVNTARHETFPEELLVKDDLAIERSRYIMTYTQKNTGNRIVETGRQVICRKKIDGKWQIAWEIWNSDQPLPK